MTLLEKARAGRRAALASLATSDDENSNVVSLFDFEPSSRSRTSRDAVPAFHSIRAEGQTIRLAA